MSLEGNSNRTFHNNTPWWFSECTLHPNRDSRRIALFLLYLFFFMFGLLENAVVVWVNWRRRHSANGVLFCIINMSLSDLMIIVMLPFTIMEVTMDHVWLWGRFLCQASALIYGVNFYSSTFFLAFMTLERYLSLTRPSTATCFPVEGRRRWLLCGGLWLLSFVLALVQNIHVDIVEWDEPGCYIMPENNTMEWFIFIDLCDLFLQFLGPGAVIITFNVLIARAVRMAPDVQGQRDVWLVHVYSLVFVVCWLPYHLVNILLLVEFLSPIAHGNPFYFFSCNTVLGLQNSHTVVLCLTLFHCIANPILYNFLSKSFRDNLISTVANCLPREVAEMGPWTQPNTADTGGKDARKQQSDMSTSHSDVES